MTNSPVAISDFPIILELVVKIDPIWLTYKFRVNKEANTGMTDVTFTNFKSLY